MSDFSPTERQAEGIRALERDVCAHFIVYLIRNVVNEKLYIGFTSQYIDKRWKGHIWDSKRGLSRILCRAIRKYGAENFSISELEYHATLDAAREDWDAAYCCA